MGFVKSLLVTALLSLAASEPSAPASAPADAPLKSWLVPAAHSTGVMLGMRGSLSLLWPRHFDPTRWSENRAQLRRSYTRPPDFRPHSRAFEWDGDPWLLNTVGHGLFGSEVYARFRQCGHAPVPALIATTLASTVWEYGFEALHKQPSAQDLVWTPLVGGLLGEGRFQLHRLLRPAPGARAGVLRTVLLFTLDPLGEAERRVLETEC
jgi:hypothetical protein